MGLFSKKKKDDAKKDEKSEPVKTDEKSKSKPKTWHISKTADGTQWQVKAEGGQRATKLFRTKAEAEDYVKVLKKNNEGSRVVSHKKDGKFQKK